MMKSPINRMGGKFRLRKKIIEKIPEHICYVEPFFGAGWTYFGKNPSTVEVINDIDGDIVNLFRVMKEHPLEFERLIQYEVISRDKFECYKNANLAYLTDIQRAVRFLYLISNSFASKGISFGYTATGNPQQKIFIENVLEIRERLKNTIIENKDVLDIIKRYDRETTFFFLDPPYINTTGYKEKFTIEDHEKLRDELKQIKGKFLLTVNNCIEARNIYKDFKIEEVGVIYSIARETKARRTYGELIITNYEYDRRYVS